MKRSALLLTVLVLSILFFADCAIPVKKSTGTTKDKYHWEQVGGNLKVFSSDFDAGNLDNLNIAADGTNIYISWNEHYFLKSASANCHSYYVKRFNGATWEQLGDKIPSSVGDSPAVLIFDSSSLAIHPDGTPFLVNIQGNIRTFPQYYDGTTWQYYGWGDGSAGAYDIGPQALFSGSTLYMANMRYDNSCVYIYHLDTNSKTWVQDGNTITPGNYPEFAAGSDSKLYVVFYVSDGLCVRSLNGSSWDMVGGVLNIDPAHAVTSPDITCMGTVPYVVWSEDLSGYGTNYQIFVKHYDTASSSWVQDGASLSVDPAAYESNTPSIACDSTTPYVTWSESNKIYVKRFNGSSWEQLGSSLNVSSSNSIYGLTPKIVISGSTPYVLWYEKNSATGADNYLYVKRWVQ